MSVSVGATQHFAMPRSNARAYWFLLFETLPQSSWLDFFVEDVSKKLPCATLFSCCVCTVTLAVVGGLLVMKRHTEASSTSEAKRGDSTD